MASDELVLMEDHREGFAVFRPSLYGLLTLGVERRTHQYGSHGFQLPDASIG